MRKVIFAALVSTAMFPCTAWAQDDTAGVQQDDDHVIVVTAQRREEKLLDVPISVTSMSSETLGEKGVISTLDLTASVPGLVMGRSTSFTQPTIRGVGSRNASSGDEANVATYIDGVYQADPIGTLQDLASVERVEVLKGPQGTLFGRNATGGAINIITKAPSYTLEGSGEATYGSYNYYKLTGYISGPLVGDVLAMSISAQAFGDDGYVRNNILGKNIGEYDGAAVRVKTLFRLSPDVSVQINGAYSRSQNNVLLSGYILGGNSRARTSLTNPALNPQGYTLDQAIALQPFTSAIGEEPLSQSTVYFMDVHFEADLGFAVLSGLASYGSTKNHTISLADHTALKLTRNEYFSTNEYLNQELVLTSAASGPFQWIVGLQGFQSDADFDPLLSSTPTTAQTRTFYGQDVGAFAAFAEVTWEPIDGLFLTGGGRYNSDKRTAYNRVGTGATTTGAATFENVSLRGVVRYQIGDNSNIYASYTEGFKSGTFNGVTAAGARTAVRPELITAYEVGAKSDFAPGWQATAAAYYYDYTDLQTSAFVLNAQGVSTTITQNAGAATIKGFEFSINGRITPNFSVNFGTNIMKTEISDFPNASTPLPTLGPGGVPLLNGNTTASVNANGNELLRAPQHTFLLGATHETDLGGGTIAISANAYFSSQWFADVSNRIKQPAYEIVNGSITWRAPGDKFYVRVFGENLTNQVYSVGFGIGAFGDATQAAKPRWAGVAVGFKF